MSKPELIVTDRLRLRPFRMEDAEDVFTYSRNPDVLRFTTGKMPESLENTSEFVRGLINKPDGAWACAVCLKEDTKVIGTIEFGIPDGAIGSIHYGLAQEYWGKGLMTEAVESAIDWAFEHHENLKAIATQSIRENIGSIRVMEKCGMTFQRNFREHWKKFGNEVELLEYGITREAWLKMKKRKLSE